MIKYDKLYKIASVMLVTGSIMFVLILAQIFIWALDRKPPFEVFNYESSAVYAGEVVEIKVNVKRDLTRSCSVTYSRLFLDSKGVMLDLTEGVRMMTSQALAELDAHNPNTLLIKIQTPQFASPGRSTVMTVLEYVCNPVHQLYPIQMIVLNEVTIKLRGEK